MKRLGIILGIVVVMIGLAGCSKPANEDGDGNLFYNKDNECTEEDYCDFVNDMRDDFIDYRDAIVAEQERREMRYILDFQVTEQCNNHIDKYVTDCSDTSKGAGAHVGAIIARYSSVGDEFQADDRDVTITILDHKESSKEIKIKIKHLNTYEYTTYFKY